MFLLVFFRIFPPIKLISWAAIRDRCHTRGDNIWASKNLSPGVLYSVVCYTWWYHSQCIPVIVVVVLTSTRIIKSVVAGQAPVTLELRNTPRRKHELKVVHAYITADAIHASARNIEKVKLGISLRCARSVLVHTSYYSRLEKTTTLPPPYPPAPLFAAISLSYMKLTAMRTMLLSWYLVCICRTSHDKA